MSIRDEIDWKLSEKAMKVVLWETRGNPIVHDYAILVHQAIKERDYKKYRRNMDMIYSYYSKLWGKSVKEVREMIEKGKKKFDEERIKRGLGK